MVKTFRWSWILVLQFQSCSRRRGEDGLQKSQIKLKTYTGEALEIIGQVRVEVTYQDQLKEKNEWFIRPPTDHHVLNGVAQWFNLTLAWKKATCRDL